MSKQGVYEPRRYTIKSGNYIYAPIAIKEAQEPSDLRSYKWAVQFYLAGIDPDIIVAEAGLPLDVIK